MPAAQHRPTRRELGRRTPDRRRRIAGLVAGLSCAALLVSGCGVEGQFPLTAPTAKEEPVAARTTPPAEKPTPTPTPTSSPTPTPKLPAMDQPTKQWEEPELPEEPSASAPTIEQITYDLESKVWQAAGKRGDTSTDCDISEDEVNASGNHEFDCTVTYREVDTTFTVKAESTETSVSFEPEVSELPLLEEKAVYEATRQSPTPPAEVMCIMDSVEVVQVDDSEAVECTVTDVYDKKITMNGELSASTFALIFSAPTPTPTG